MASPLLAAVELRLASATDPRDAACLHAERAALLACQGRLDTARSELAALHAHHGGRIDALASAWLHLADGLVLHFSASGAAARDRLGRALALGSAAGAHRLQALSAAWLAQLACLDEDFASTAKFLKRSLAVADRSHHTARSRACLVAAQAWHWAGRFDLAQPWYRRARLHATAEGDQATLGALMHDMAWLHTVQARQTQTPAAGVVRLQEVGIVFTSVESVCHFVERTGMAALAPSVHLLRAHALVMLERYGEAGTLFAAHLETAVSSQSDGPRCAALVDLAWCRLNTGDTAEAAALASTAQGVLHEGLSPHQQAFVQGRLAQLHARLGNDAAAATHAEQAAVAWAVHGSAQHRAASLLDEALSTVAADQI